MTVTVVANVVRQLLEDWRWFCTFYAFYHWMFYAFYAFYASCHSVCMCWGSLVLAVTRGLRWDAG